MPQKRISFTNFNRRLVLAGGREQAGEAALRRASGVAPELTTSVLSRWGSVSLYDIAAIQLYYWNNHRYQYDGSVLYRDGVSVVSGFNGNRITFNSMPPQPGLQDYLFILGGGKTPFKIAPDGTITNWGIVQPENSMVAANVPWDQLVIDDFENSSGLYSITGGTKGNESTIVQIGDGSLFMNPTGTPSTVFEPVKITRQYFAAQNWAQYSSGDFSLNTDVFQIWLYIDNFGATQPATWIEIDVDINDGSFKKDWYSFGVGLLNPGSRVQRGPDFRRSIQLEITFQPGQWQQLTLPKSQFMRHGDNTELDWSMVQGYRIQAGILFVATAKYYLDNFTLSGGAGLGAGPAVGNGGSEYIYYTTFQNLVTGSESNPQATPTRISDVADNKVQLTNIPVSTDLQVGARNIYRSVAQTIPGPTFPAFLLDTIWDNTTTTYLDSVTDFTIPLAQTPWTANIMVPPVTPPTHPSPGPYYIDAGNGYYFRLTTSGTTGAQPPPWKIPTTDWSPVSIFLLNETIAPRKANGQFWIVTTRGTSATTQPNWAASPGIGSTILDGTVVWTNQGLQTTADNSAVWTFQGINSTQTLTDQGLLFDNLNPQSTYDDAYGPSPDNTMLFARDSAATGYVYSSPPGRPESVGQAYPVSSSNDPIQKVTEWDGQIWVYSTARCYRGFGTYPQISFPAIDDSLGTLKPYTVVPVKLIGIMSWAPDGIRIMNYSGSVLIGFRELAPIFRGQPEENVLIAWNETTGPVWAEESRNEVIFSDGTDLTLGLTYDGTAGPVWRQPGRILTAGYYEHQTGEFAVAFGGTVYLFEHPGSLSDG
jgi:hypothetical protein